MKYACCLPLQTQEIFCTKKEYFVRAKYRVPHRLVLSTVWRVWEGSLSKYGKISKSSKFPRSLAGPGGNWITNRRKSLAGWQLVEHCRPVHWSDWLCVKTLVLHNTITTHHTPQSITKIRKYPIYAEVKCGGTVSHSDLNSQLLTGRNIQSEGPTLN